MKKDEYADLFFFIAFYLAIAALINSTVIILYQYLGSAGFDISVVIVAVVLFFLPVALTRKG